MNIPLAHYTPSMSTLADLKKRRRIRAKDHLFLIIRYMGQKGKALDGVTVPHIKRIIGSHHHPPRAHCLDQEVKGRHRVDQRIKAEKSKVIAGRPVNICPSLGPYFPAMLP